MSEHITVTRRGSVAHLLLNRPDDGNMITADMLEKVAEVVGACAGDADLRAVVLEGAGKDFCLGRDPKSRGPRPPSAMEFHQRSASRILAVYAAFRNCPVPILAVVQGRAAGFGCAMVGASDVAIAAAGARFSLPEMSHRTPPTLAMHALARVSPKVLGHMVYSQEEIDAETARGAGLVSAVVPEDGLAAARDRLLQTMEGYDQVAIRTVKRFIRSGLDLPADVASDLAGYTLATVSSRP